MATPHLAEEPSGSGDRSLTSDSTTLELWHAAEDGSWQVALRGAVEGTPERDLARLCEAHEHEVDLRAEAALEVLEVIDADALPARWRGVFDLLFLRAHARRGRIGLTEVRRRIRTLLETLPADEAATRARAWHLLGSMQLRNNAFDEAERSLQEALAAVQAGSRREAWILDSFGQVFKCLGGWEESRRTYRGVIERKRAHGDHMGMMISAANLAMMEMRLGRYEVARQLLEDILVECGATLSGSARLRARTLLVECALDAELRQAGHASEIEDARGQLEALMAEGAGERHYLRGFAHLALARADHRAGDEAGLHQHLVQAQAHMVYPEQKGWVAYWRAVLSDDPVSAEQWFNATQEFSDDSAAVFEPEVKTYLHFARQAETLALAREHLDVAHELAVASHNPLLLHQVEVTYADLDPRGAADLRIRRFSGRQATDLEETRREEVTIIFADLVSFTRRSNELEPEEVMATVRSLFQLAAPLMTQFQVQPTQYLGDGLLAVAQGAGHEKRGLDFAFALVRRTAGVTRVRHALEESWGLELRCGVASGHVVLGVVGSLLKQEYATIGPTTNLAARLQGAAEPGEVVCSASTAAAAQATGTPEELTLKGYSKPVAVTRFR